jgi:ADP-L-glycero-D-manno-heptose 6-epimerase
MRNVIVTGSRGFIGKSLSYKLERDGYNVLNIDDNYFNGLDWGKELLELLESSKYDAVFHVGACSDTLETNVDYMMTRNYESTKIIMDWCLKNNKPMIYSSSAANYGVNNLYPANLYGWSKYVAEGYVISNGGIALRYFNVYGPGEENKGKMASVAYQMFQKNKKDEKIFLFPKKPQRDFVYVKDVISANIHALLNYDKLRGSYYEVGSGEDRTFEDVLNNMEITFGYTSEDLIPNGYQFYTCSDKLKWMNGWESEWNLEKGILDYKKYLVG